MKITINKVLFAFLVLSPPTSKRNYNFTCQRAIYGLTTKKRSKRNY